MLHSSPKLVEKASLPATAVLAVFHLAADNGQSAQALRLQSGRFSLMTCSLCGAENAEGALNCKSCGASLRLSAGEPPAPDLDATAPALARRNAPSSAVGVATPPPLSSTRSDSVTASMKASDASGVLEPGTAFGPRYRIESMLGRGGMGAVYKAYDLELDRMVALKLVRPELTSDDDVMQRFKQELLLASKISHKNILRIHDLGDADGVKFISMAYIDGEDLHHLLKRRGPLPASEISAIGRQLCAALEAAHAEGVVHRDLKPQNVLVDHEGTAYVSDFGLAKSLEAAAASMTHTGMLLGSPRYMAPEQVEGKPADRRSDLYSLGLIFYELATGDSPFGGESAYQTMYERTRVDPKNPKLLRPDLPDDLVRVIMRCLERQPARRYQNAHEILMDLEGGSPALRLQSLSSVLVRPGRGRWPLLLAGAAALVVALSLGLPRLWEAIHHPQAPGERHGIEQGVPPLDQGKYIAVLPFRVLGDKSSLGYVAEGLRDALSAKLFQSPGVHIASQDAAEKEDENKSDSQIGRDLGANLIVRGTVSAVGGKLVIVANLENAATGELLSSQDISGAPEDLLTLEDNVYSKIADALQLNTSGGATAFGAGHPTENLAAYDNYLKGSDALRGPQDPKNLEAAINYYTQALQKDPNFALAYAGMADASVKMYREKKQRFWAEKALTAAQQAQRLDDKLPQVHVSLGSVYLTTGKTAQAIEEFSRALLLAPGSDEAYRRLGMAYEVAGNKDKAISTLNRAVEINPYYWLNYNSLGQVYLNNGDYTKALAAYEKVTQLEPDNVWGYQNVGAVYFSEGKYNECIPAFQKALQLQPTADIYSDLGTAYFYLKRYTDSVTMFEKATELNPNDEINVGNLADAYRWSGQKAKADATYDKAIALAFKDLQVNPRDAAAMQSLALYYAKKGDAANAQDFIRRARAIDRNNVNYIYGEAVVDMLAGHPSEALRPLREAFEKGFAPVQAVNDPELEGLHQNPEFRKLVAQFNHKQG
jgi:eukaryotic-like serine/threonine-protein kinase